MSTDLFKFRRAFVDASDLRRQNVPWPVILRLVTLSVRFTQEELQIRLLLGSNVTEYDELSGYSDFMYWQCSLAALRLNHPTLSIDIVFNNESADDGFIEFVPQSVPGKPQGSPQVFQVPGSLAVPLMAIDIPHVAYVPFKRVLFAGTFDHLHAGHKSVLTRALFMTHEILYVGFASEALLQRKSCPNALESLRIRQHRVRRFLETIRPATLSHVEIVMIETHDAVGPAATLDFDALVVTPETSCGGALVNQARVANGKAEVEIVSVNLLGNSEVAGKLSSTSVRKLLCDGLEGGEDTLNFLFESWVRLNERLGTPKPVVSDWWSRLRDLQGLQPWRVYHTLRHVHELLLIAEADVGEPIPIEILLCIWFHDAVYQPRLLSSEADSAALFESFAEEAHLPPDVNVSVNHAILLTKDHRKALAEDAIPTWVKQFLELDLSILGSPPDRYVEYAGQIKSEYSHIGADQFKRGRTAFLQSMAGFRFRELRSAERLNERMELNIHEEIAYLL